MLRRFAHENGVVSYQAEALAALGVRHGFTTRLGGVSEGPYASLNLGSLAKGGGSDANTAVAENFRRLRAALDCRQALRAAPRQVHGAGVWTPPAEPQHPAEAPEADAVVSDCAHVMLTIRTADCLPLLLAGAGGRVAAAVHVGWRGLLAGIVPETLGALHAKFGVEAGELTGAIGPHIGRCHFEVGEEVARQFDEAGLSSAVHREEGRKPHVDLQQAVLAQLQQAGVSADRIETTDRCTYRDEAEFFSHRRDHGVTGRMAAVIVAGGDCR